MVSFSNSPTKHQQRLNEIERTETKPDCEVRGRKLYQSLIRYSPYQYAINTHSAFGLSLFENGRKAFTDIPWDGKRSTFKAFKMRLQSYARWVCIDKTLLKIDIGNGRLYDLLEVYEHLDLDGIESNVASRPDFDCHRRYDRDDEMTALAREEALRDNMFYGALLQSLDSNFLARLPPIPKGRGLDESGSYLLALALNHMDKSEEK
jgi:hypothetical protein